MISIDSLSVFHWTDISWNSFRTVIFQKCYIVYARACMRVRVCVASFRLNISLWGKNLQKRKKSKNQINIFCLHFVLNLNGRALRFFVLARLIWCAFHIFSRDVFPWPCALVVCVYMNVYKCFLLQSNEKVIPCVFSLRFLLSLFFLSEFSSLLLCDFWLFSSVRLYSSTLACLFSCTKPTLAFAWPLFYVLYGITFSDPLCIV